MKEIILIKFGGAVLTEKKTPCTICRDAMEGLVQQLSLGGGHLRGRLVLGNGGGSFGHYYAKEFDLTHGVDTPEKLIGLCMGKAGNAYLNGELIQSLLRHQIPACTCPISSSFLEEGGHLEIWMQVLSYLEHGILPVVYGDMIYSVKEGCQIISTEAIFLAFTQMLAQNPSLGYQVGKIIFCTDRGGVVDEQGNIISVIERESFRDWDIFWSDTKGYDVTGGMFEKVRIAVEIMQCPVQIINGNLPNDLEKALDGDLRIGTVIM